MRRSDARDRTQSAWLDSRHTFAFGTYDRIWSGLGALKVLNDDVIAPGHGFGLHPHWDMEIVTWVLEGALVHEDDLGHRAEVGAGGAQLLSAGTGVEHAERNAGAAPLRLFQIWIAPGEQGLAPRHATLAAPRPDARGLALLAAPDGEGGALPIRADARVYAGVIAAGAEVTLPLADGRRGWLQLADGAVTIEALGAPDAPLALAAGDGVAVIARAGLRLRGAGATARLAWFDLA